MNYNLLEEPWIPVLYNDGVFAHVGILDAFAHATRIRQIPMASPSDLFAVHRFMLTLLYWKAPLAGGVERARLLLLEDKKLPEPLLSEIGNEASRFDLFSQSAPFLQDTSVRNAKKKKSVGSLFAELATGTNVAHFHHGDDENLLLCLPCVAFGLLRVVPWTQAGGRKLTPSIHNEPPIMALAVGRNLSATLGLNLVPLNAKPGTPQWSGHFKPTDPGQPVPYLEAFTWRPRRIFLPQPGEQNGVCWYCGKKEAPTVGPKIVYENNEETKRRQDGKKKLPFIWQDPSAFYTEQEPYKPAASTTESWAMDNRDLKLLTHSTSASASENPSHQDWCLIIPCTDKRNKTFDHRLLDLPTPSPDSIEAMLRPPATQTAQGGPAGWNDPKPGSPAGTALFARAATRILTQADWAALSNAAFKDMHDAPAAFGLFAGLYWGLRGRNAAGLPSRNAAWLTLKLMATLPAKMRALTAGATFSPLALIPKHQTGPTRHKFRYPASLPPGPRLEAALRDALDANSRRRKPEPVDWAGLCNGLNQLLD